MPRFSIIAILLILVLSACSSRYQAPVDELGDEPLFLDSGRVHRVNGGETLYVIAWMYDLDVNALARANDLQDPYPITVGQLLKVDLRNQTASPSVVANAATTTAAVSRPVVTAPAIQRTPLETTPLTRTPLPSAETPPPVASPPRDEPSSNAPVVSAPPLTTPSAAPPPLATVTPPPVVPLPEPVVEPAPVPVAPPKAIANSEINWDWPASGSIIGGFADSGVENKGVDFDGNRGDAVMAAADGEVVYAGSGLLRYGDLVILKHNDSFLSAYAHNSVISVKEGDRVTRGQKIAELGSSGIDRNMLHFEIRLDGKPVDPLLYLPDR